MPIPLFSYSPELYQKVYQSGLLFSQNSILKLKCLKDVHWSIEQKDALVNFELCKSTLIKNSNHIYQTGPEFYINKYESLFTEWMVNCALIMELQDWSKYKSMADFNLSSFVCWCDDQIFTTRLFSDLL